MARLARLFLGTARIASDAMPGSPRAQVSWMLTVFFLVLMATVIWGL